MSQAELSPDIYSKMQTDSPFKVYKKTILGQVAIWVINPFSGNPECQILRGDPKKNEPNCFISLWSEKEDAYFKRANERQFEMGNIVAYTKPLEERKPTVNELTDEQMEEIINAKGFMKLQATLNKMTAVAPVYRMLQIAEDNEKSEKILGAIRKRMAELQTLKAEGKAE